MNTFHVTVLEIEGGPDAAMRERLARCAAYRLESLAKRRGYLPVVTVDPVTPPAGGGAVRVTVRVGV